MYDSTSTTSTTGTTSLHVTTCSLDLHVAITGISYRYLHVELDLLR
jgi:hypothetical protein